MKKATHCKNCGKFLEEKRKGGYCSDKCYFKANPEVHKKVVERRKNPERIAYRKAWLKKNKEKMHKYFRTYRKEERRKEKEEIASKEYIKLRCKLHQDWLEKHGFKNVIPTVIDEHKGKCATLKKEQVNK